MVVVAATKTDKLSRNQQLGALRVVEKGMSLPKGGAVPFSAVEGAGSDALWARIHALTGATAVAAAGVMVEGDDEPGESLRRGRAGSDVGGDAVGPTAFALAGPLAALPAGARGLRRRAARPPPRRARPRHLEDADLQGAAGPLDDRGVARRPAEQRPPSGESTESRPRATSNSSGPTSR